jgi:DNA-binding NarL/FixJ family response regulator
MLALTLATRTGLRALLGGDKEIDVVADAPTLEELEDLPDNIDVIIAEEGATSNPQWQDDLLQMEPPPAMLLLTVDPQSIHSLAGLPLRAWSILQLDTSQEELVAAVKALNQGLLVLAPTLMKSWFEPRLIAERGALEHPLDELTSRESQVLELLSQGLANKQIALELDISEHTVKFHVSSIYSKLGATNRTEAVRLGARMGLITL